MTNNGRSGGTAVLVVDEAGPVGAGDPSGAAVRSALADGVRRLAEHEAAAPAGDPEGVHQLRAAARRLRGVLHTFAPLLDESWAEALSDDLRGPSHALGAVRDLDVLRDRLKDSAAELADALGPLWAALDARHEAASASLRDHLRAESHRALLARLADAAHAPRLTAAAEGPCRDVLPTLVADAWKALAKRARDLGPDSADADYHEARKRAKRARYAAEAVAPALGAGARKRAERFARRVEGLQDVLGEHQDAVVARDEVERVARDHPGDAPFLLAAGRLVERQARAARAARDDFARAWEDIDQKKRRRWMKP
ncbi:MAG TPA: CHAD domain-containing protein [Isosphaeraceae bacterium]|jgi:CHAD domain-containing protein|nr:CHAD domain-containing protein [Isosphaeraceae bacterium]